MKDSYMVSDSDKYIANVCFVAGFAFWSLVGVVAVLFGGWYLLGDRELKNARNR